MATRRTIVLAAAAGLGLAAVACGAVALAAQDDPRIQVGAVAVDRVDAAALTGAGNTGDQRVAALDTIEGTLERRGDDPDDFYVGAVELEFGPEAWVRTAGPGEDYDGDGTPEDLLAELKGLVGQPVTALVRLDNDGDDADVYVLNDLTYRDSAGGPAPWLQAGTTAGKAASPQAVAEAAAAAVGDGARVDELDRQAAGDVAWEAAVITADGREHTVLLDSAGEVLDTRQDD
jgi:hypothetical protein